MKNFSKIFLILLCLYGVQAKKTVAQVNTPTALAATNITATGFTMNWEYEWLGPRNFKVEVATDSGFSNIVQTTNTGTVFGIVFSMPSITLLSGTDYYYRVTQKQGGTSNTIPVTTICPTTQPTALSESNVTSTSFRANWSSIPSGQDILLELSTDNFANYTEHEVSGTHHDFSGLTVAEVYEYRIRTKNVCPDVTSYSSYSNTISAQTTPQTPTIRDMSCDDANPYPNGGFSAKWHQVEGATSYDIYYAFNAGSTTKNSDASDSSVWAYAGYYQPWTTGLFKVRARYDEDSRATAWSAQWVGQCGCFCCGGCSGYGCCSGRTSSTAFQEENIENLESYDITQLYPNPTKESINIEVCKDDLLKRIDVHDVAGKLLFQQNNLELQNTKYQLDLKQLKSGTYIITGYSDTGRIFNEKIMKE